MKKHIKIFSLLLCIVMVCSLMAACGNNGLEHSDIEIASPEELDPAIIGDYGTLKLPIDKNGTVVEWLIGTDVTTHNDSVIVKELRRRTGINVQVVAVPLSSYAQKVKIYIASQDQMPELMYPNGFGAGEVNDLGRQGAFVDVLKYKNELPTFKKIFFDEAKERNIENDIKNLMSSDGKLYYFPTYDYSRDVNHGFLYRKDIFDKHGIKVWEPTKESFIDTLKQLKKLYPNSTPLVSKTGTGIFNDFGYFWDLRSHGLRYNEAKAKWEYGCITEDYKEMLDYIKQLFNEGLLDPEFITATQPAWTTKMTQRDKAFVTWDWIGRLDMFKQQTASSIPEYDLRYAPPIGGKVRSLGRTGGGCVIKKGPAEEICLKLNDYLLSDSGAQLMTMGIEGVTYTLREDGKADYIGFEGQRGVGITDLESKYGLYIQHMARRYDRRCSYYDFTEREQEAQDMMNNMPGGGYLPVDPTLSYTAEEMDVASRYQSEIHKAAEEFATKYVLNSNYGEKEWKEWVARADKLGIYEVLKVQDAAQARYDKL